MLLTLHNSKSNFPIIITFLDSTAKGYKKRIEHYNFALILLLTR